MARVIRERELDNCVITNGDGAVIFNAAQADEVIVRRVYDDGNVDILLKSTGRVLIPPYDPMNDHPRCRHCGEVL